MSNKVAEGSAENEKVVLGKDCGTMKERYPNLTEEHEPDTSVVQEIEETVDELSENPWTDPVAYRNTLLSRFKFYYMAGVEDCLQYNKETIDNIHTNLFEHVKPLIEKKYEVEVKELKDEIETLKAKLDKSKKK